MQVILLAGGRGSRFLNLTDQIPKPMVKIAETPLIVHVMSIYTSRGYNKFLICTGYLSEVIVNYFSQYRHGTEGIYGIYTHPRLGEIKLAFSDGGETSTTAKRLLLIKEILDDKFMLTYADGVADVDLNGVVCSHLKNNCIATISAVKVTDPFGSLVITGDKVTGFLEKKEERWINGGFMLCDKRILQYIDTSKMLEEYTFPLLASEGKLGVYKHEGFWQCVDNIHHKMELEKLIREKGYIWQHDNK